MDRVIILGAGAPYSGDDPLALKQTFTGRSMIQWLADATKCTMQQITYVAGYQFEAIQAAYPNLNIIQNGNWMHTGSGESLLKANLRPNESFLACYGDILFRPAIVDSLKASKAVAMLGIAPGKLDTLVESCKI